MRFIEGICTVFCGSEAMAARFARSALAVFAGTSTVMLFAAKPFALAALKIEAITFAVAFEEASASINILSVTGTESSAALACSSEMTGNVDEIWLDKFSNLMSSTTSVMPYLSHISGIDKFLMRVTMAKDKNESLTDEHCVFL